jgi:site-specific DNA-adenine methylase
MTVLRPFFKCYGSKWSLSRLLPAPRYDTICEVFAGGAGYACRYGAGKRVLLYDADPIIVQIWQWLLQATPDDVLVLPVDFGAQDIRALDLAEAPMRLIQKWLTAQGSANNWWMPPAQLRILPTHPGSVWSATVRQRIAEQLDAIRGWSIEHVDYTDVPKMLATYSVDPPYQKNSRSNSYGAFVRDYKALGEWCRDLPGQVFVHEQAGADWLEFKILQADAVTGRTGSGTRKRQDEVAWFNS